MDQEHRADENHVLFIIDIDLRQACILVIFCLLAGSRLGHWDVYLGLNRFILVTRILNPKVELDELFAVFRATLHWLACIISIRLTSRLVRTCIHMEDAGSLLSKAAETLER